MNNLVLQAMIDGKKLVLITNEAPTVEEIMSKIKNLKQPKDKQDGREQ